MAKVDSWLVKSSGHILGPYTRLELIKLLRSKELVVLDEVARPCQRWVYIRDQVEFSDIVDEIRRGQFGSDDTTTDVLSANTQTFTETADRIDDELTEEINIAAVDEIIYENVKESGAARRAKTTKQVDSFAFEGDRAVQAKAQETTRLLWFVTAGIIFSVVAFVVFKKVVKAPENKGRIAKERIEKAIKDLQVGDYQLALSGFKDAYDLQPDNSATYIYLGSLLIQVEGQTVQGKRLLQKVLDLGEKYPKRAVTGLGLASLLDGDSKLADEYFDKALDMDPIYLPARINLGASALMSGQFSEANSHLHLAIKEGSQDGAALIMLAESFIRLWTKDGKIEHLNQAQKMLRQFAKNSFDYYQEVSFLDLYIRHLKEKLDDPEDSFVRILDMDPYQTQLHRHNVFVYRNRAKWNTFLDWCNKIVQKHNMVKYAKAFQAFCLIKAGDRIGANRVIDDAVTRNPKDPLVQAVYAVVLEGVGLEEQASVAMGKAVEFDPREEFRLPLLLQARFCQDSGDVKCAKSYWQKLLSLEPLSLPGIAGVAHVNLKNASYSDAEKYLGRGKRLSENYRPFLKLSREIKDLGLDDSSSPQGF